MAKKIAIELTSAIAIGGKVKSRGSVVSVDEKLAKNILQRGKGNLHAGALVGTTDDGEETAVAPRSEHTVAELKDIAAEYEIAGASSMNKEQLIEAIEAFENGDADEKGGEE